MVSLSLSYPKSFQWTISVFRQATSRRKCITISYMAGIPYTVLSIQNVGLSEIFTCMIFIYSIKLLSGYKAAIGLPCLNCKEKGLFSAPNNSLASHNINGRNVIANTPTTRSGIRTCCFSFIFI